MKPFLLLVCLLILASAANAQTHIRISAPKYKGETLILCKYDNYVTKKEKELAKCEIDSIGNAYVAVDIDAVQYVFMRYEKLIYYFFVEPDSDINVIFAEKELLSEKEKLNPFFEPLYIAAKVTAKNSSNISLQLLDIDGKSDEIILAVVKNKKEKDRHFKDSLLNVLKNSLDDYSNEFVNSYAKYRIASIEYLFKLKSVRDLQYEYFVGKPILYRNPAYCELFNHINEKYFLHRTQQAQGNVFRQAVNRGNLSAIRKLLSQNADLQDKDFCDFLILHNAYNEFYDSNFSRSALLSIVDSIAQETENNDNKILAEDISNAIVNLLAGYFPPDFELYDMQGNKKSLKSFAGKYLYLGFFSVNSYGCIQDFYLMKHLAEKFGNKVHFVSICIDTKDDIENFIKTEQYDIDWTFLLCYNNKNIIKEYDVRTFPTYYLIDRSGKLLQSPAPSPSEDIYQIFEKLSD
ncbi:MAG: TlpA family protein disulfide reductase [Prevotellaceae bacterium]|jgi:peroxiredoxin|nr:TlpA family protein disulfide reductase [Prevotellaceae bacterium]